MRKDPKIKFNYQNTQYFGTPAKTAKKQSSNRKKTARKDKPSTKMYFSFLFLHASASICQSFEDFVEIFN